MCRIKKLFGGLNMSWKNLIIFALVAGAYTALINQIPFFYDTSIRDIAITFEWWVLFGVIIITNGKTPLDSALKAFVFFLISQPLIYLVQVPFKGWEIMGYYKNWILWTLLTFPMGYVGWYMRKQNIFSVLILSAMNVLLSVHAAEFLNKSLLDFPRHLLSAIFCVALIVVFILCIFERKRERIVGFCIAAVALAVFMVMTLSSSMNFSANLLFDENPPAVNANWQVTTSDPSVGEASIFGNQVNMHFRKPGSTELTLTDENGESRVFVVSVDKELQVSLTEKE